MKNLNDSLDNKILKYYEKYYSHELGLKDWKERCNLRLNEESEYCIAYIQKIKEWLDYDFKNKKVLVVGSGTGGEIVNFYNIGADVYGIEPNEEAIEISHIKAEKIGLDKNRVKKGYSEKLSFDDNEFDFVYCYTVLEHVYDVEKSIKEMIRVVRENGHIFIHTPDYRQFYEPHYKAPLPMFLPNFINKIILLILKKPTKFLDTINKVSSLSLRRIFQKLPIHHFRMYTQVENFTSDRFAVRIILNIQKFLFLFMGISSNQAWILKKKKSKNI